MSKIEFINDDCMNVMANYPDKHFDLAIVDPPYGISINMNMGRKKGQPKKHSEKKWDDEIPSELFFEELFRISKNQIIWGGNYFPLPIVRGWIFWDKEVPDGVSFSDGELAWTSFDRVLKKITVPYSGFIGTEGKIHPTQKPIKLYRNLLIEYGMVGDKILDCFGGSMSHAIACDMEGFDLVIIEKDKEYFDSAIKRFNEYKSQTKLF